MQTNFAITGVAGFVAPRHLRAIKECGGELSAAYDPADSVGIMDQYFPSAAFFTLFEQFFSHLDWQRRQGKPVGYVAICSPNHLHKSHIHAAMRLGANTICEKPLVLNAADLDDLAELEAETGRTVSTILQLRLHPAILALKQQIDNTPDNQIFDVDLSYITSRGQWYHSSWKGAAEKSGGIATNIGIHFFDMLGFVFGQLQSSTLHYRSVDAAAGWLEFDRARVRWLLSINRDHLPRRTAEGQTTFRSIRIDGEEIEFSLGFTDLHTESYREILNGNGFSLSEARQSIEIVHDLRHAKIDPLQGEQHPDLARILGER